MDGSTDFYRNWNEYKVASHNYWIGKTIDQFCLKIDVYKTSIVFVLYFELHKAIMMFIFHMYHKFPN